MYTKRSGSVTPLSVSHKSHANGPNGLVTAATFRYTEEPAAVMNGSSSASSRRRNSMHRPRSRQQSQTSHTSHTSHPSRSSSIDQMRTRRQRSNSSLANHNNNNSNTMATTTAASAATAAADHPMTPMSPPLGYVRALYDYESGDDRTSLSFRQGDVIEVITQLESGWWDGFLRGVRGWFPSNYCVVHHPNALADPANPHGAGAGASGEPPGDEPTDESSADEEGGDDEREDSIFGARARQDSQTDDDADGDQDEAPWWIPQVTNDGRLYYYNTRTHKSKMDLPFRSPTSLNEQGPRDPRGARGTDQARPPPEMLVRGGLERDEDETSASESEMPHQHRRRRRSQISDGLSPAASFESLSASQDLRGHAHDLARSNPLLSTQSGGIGPGFASNLTGPYAGLTLPRSFFDDGGHDSGTAAVPGTWTRLIENMRRAVESYRQAIINADRAEYVHRAEDISDHLRLLLAAASGTTDNHSGTSAAGAPSIISANKALYPHFRDMMSRFSKLVLSSHIAAADWPAPDAYSKCLQEADGVLHGVCNFVEVARAQRGEDLPRLTPGFVRGAHVGGAWRNHHLGPAKGSPRLPPPPPDADEPEPAAARLDERFLERLDERQRPVLAALRRLDEHLAVPDKMVGPARHEQIATAICSAAAKVVEPFRAYLGALESAALAPVAPAVGAAPLHDFAAQKQRLFDLIAGLVLACQTVAGPLSDEWADVRGEPLENRLRDVAAIAKQLETAMAQARAALLLLLQAAQADAKPGREPPKRVEGAAPYAKPARRGPGLDGFGQLSSGIDNSLAESQLKNTKLQRIFGFDPPAGAGLPGPQEEIPAFLKLDHEEEMAFDTKVDPPQLRGGTLPALVEQLTRHDRPQPHFISTFLLTYRSFTSAAELFEMLVRRFGLQPPRGLGADDYRLWVERKQKPIRLRVVNILKTWLETYWMEGADAGSAELLRRIHAFATDALAPSAIPGTQPLLAVVEQRRRGQDPTNRVLVLNLDKDKAPPPIVPKNMKKLKFLDIDATEFARQLTIIESRLYGKIRPTECLNKTWQKKLGPDEAEPAPHVKALILHSNQLTNWVAEMILTQSDVKKRVVVIKHFVSVADKCRQLNNFSTLTSIISALGTAPIHRLGRTWAQVNARTSATLETMRALMASTKNFGEYRETLHSANPPCIPFFGVYLTDLTFIEDGIPGVLKRTSLINFAKRQKTAEVICDIQQYQNVPYPLVPVPELQDYILSNMQAAGDVVDMYERSLQVEPREREDEKIARLLSESGFL